AITFTMLGVTYFGLGDYLEALKYHYASLKIREELGDQKAIAATYHNLGNVYYSQGNYEEAIKSYKTSVSIKRKINDTLDSHYAHTLNNMANFYEEKKDRALALKLYTASWQISQKLNDQLGILSTRSNMGNIYLNAGDYNQAEKTYYECLELAEEIGDKAAVGAIYISIGNLYLKKNKFEKALKFVNKGFEMALAVGSKDDIRNAFYYLWQIEEALGNHKKSYSDFVNYLNYRDSLDNEESRRASVQTQMLYEFSKKEAFAKAEQDKKDLEYAAQKKHRSMILWISFSGLALVLVFSLFLYNRFKITQRQKATIEEQKLEVDLQKDLAGKRMEIAEKQKTVIEAKQNEILDSIIYARRIQSSLLPSEKMISKELGRLKNNYPES
ncbi:MAG: tetratricopeptide repeat protein, partial [Bacteroidetes bacterium]|nr:tetratricopeptide repeat protein [Bacteroidota bacterium]